MYQYNDYELLYLISEQDELALDIMYKKYIPLIKARIAAFRIKEFNREDFFQEGLFMLHKAISTYRPDSGKTFNKYFDMILQRHYIQLRRKESKHFYNVVLTDELDYLKEEKEEGIVLYTLIGVIQSGNDYALVNISCKEETDIQWLLDTFASIFRDPKNQ